VSALLASFAVQEARPSDLDDIAALEQRAFPIPWKREYFAGEVGTAHRFNRVIRADDGTLIGYVFCAHAAGEIHVNKIAVAERWRRFGMARRLMAEVLRFGHATGAEEIYLEVRPSNAPARRFYQGIGFVDAGLRKGYYLDGEDALVMVRRLP
jgi:ribosomal-protein-alanine N-acetyltransferase